MGMSPGVPHLESFSELPKRGWLRLKGLDVVLASDQDKSRAEQAPATMIFMRSWHFGI